MVRWGDAFWGEGNRGFEVLSTNLKNGGIAIEEFQRFLTESSQCESTYCKNLSRLQSQLLKVQHVGTFTPIWHSIRDLLEKIASTHTTTMSLYQDLLRDVHIYHDAYQKKVKMHVQKDPDISRTAELISQLNNALNTVNKAKEQYQSIGLDYERAKRVAGNITNGSSTPTPQENSGPTQTPLASAFNTLTSSTRQVERLERKYRQAHDDYRVSIEKYNSIRNEYEKRFFDACTKFQDFEIEHIDKMLAYGLSYSDLLKQNNDHTRLAQNEFNERLKLFTGSDLLETFVEQKKTGIERPTPLQFEELDNLKTSMQLTNSTTPDASSAATADELMFFGQHETAVPSFQAHFPVSSPTFPTAWPPLKKSDSNRASQSQQHHKVFHALSSSAIGNQQLLTNTQPVSSSMFNSAAPMSLNNPNHPLSHLQTPGNNNDQSFNPFDVKIKKPTFKGLWPSNRKEKKDKKTEKKITTPVVAPNAKSNKIIQLQQRDETGSVNSQNSGLETSDIQLDSMDGLNQISSNVTKSKCPTPEPYTQSSPSITSSGANRLGCQSTIPFSSSGTRKKSQRTSSSSSETSDDDDDDDFPLAKIQFKINPTSILPPKTEQNEDAKISDAMRLIDKNIGHLATYSRATGRRIPDMSKSVSFGQIGTRAPPPLPLRPPPNMSASVTAESVTQTAAFPSSPPRSILMNSNEGPEHRSKSLSMSTSPHQGPPPPPVPVHIRSMTVSTVAAENKKTTSISSTEDDSEVASSFIPDGSTPIKAPPFTIPRPPRSRQPIHDDSSSSLLSHLHASENNLSLVSSPHRSSSIKKSKSDLVDSDRAGSILERLRAIWKLRRPVVFRKIHPPMVAKSSFGFLPIEAPVQSSSDLASDSSSIDSFHSACETVDSNRGDLTVTISLSFTAESASAHRRPFISLNDIRLRHPSNLRSEQPQPTVSSAGPSMANGRMTPFIASSSIGFGNSFMSSNEQRMSPLTIGSTDQIPIAIAYQETIHVMMCGDDQSKWKIRILGDMLVSFPAAILHLLADPSPHLNTLEFRLKNLSKVENIIANPQLVVQNQETSDQEGPIYSFNMPALSGILRNLQEKNRSLPFFNFGVLKYEVKHAGVSNIPIQVSSQWTRSFDTISVHITYRFNSSAFPESIRMTNDMVTFYTIINDGQQISDSLPMAEWSLNEHKLSWKVPYTFDGMGTLSATLATVQSATEDSDSDTQRQQQPLTTSSIIHVQFLGENALFSAIDFEFTCRGYRVSLLKKKICSGKYQSEPDQSEPLQLFRRPSVDPQHRIPLVA